MSAAGLSISGVRRMVGGGNVVFNHGSGEVPRLVGFPEGRCRVRARNDGYVRIFVRPPGGGVRCFVPRWGFTAEGEWVWVCDPELEQGANVLIG